MKNSCSFFSFFLIFSTSAQSQVLRKETILDMNILRMIADYESESVTNRWRFEDKGIMAVSKQHTDTIDIYTFQTHIDDRFMDNPPNGYAHVLGSAILLIYDVDAKGNILQNKISRQDSLFLLEEIGDRIYTRPKVKEHWEETRVSATEVVRHKIVGKKKISLGGGTHINYYFNGTTYKKRKQA